jgi:2-hydroxychromene-2-carboxylate isomerase
MFFFSSRPPIPSGGRGFVSKAFKSPLNDVHRTRGATAASGPGAGGEDAARAKEKARRWLGDYWRTLFLFWGEPFWGHDRMPLLEERLREAGLGT